AAYYPTTRAHTLTQTDIIRVRTTLNGFLRARMELPRRVDRRAWLIDQSLKHADVVLSGGLGRLFS
ncbi:MAG: hypothetical protein ACRDHW_21405, partial [Ktedonobacteraceae bacterium]